MLDSDGELQIKDLLIKLDVLTYGLIKERKKAQSYLVRINELQNSLQTKENGALLRILCFAWHVSSGDKRLCRSFHNQFQG